MRKSLSYILVGLTLTASLCASCNKQKRKDGRTDTYSSGRSVSSLTKVLNPSSKKSVMFSR